MRNLNINNAIFWMFLVEFDENEENLIVKDDLSN